jgi:hypothetical protein
MERFFSWEAKGKYTGFRMAHSKSMDIPGGSWQTQMTNLARAGQWQISSNRLNNPERRKIKHVQYTETHKYHRRP